MRVFGRSLAGRFALVLLGVGVLGALYTAYLRLSLATPSDSDHAGFLLVASDVLAGNWLLRGWNLGTVSY